MCVAAAQGKCNRDRSGSRNVLAGARPDLKRIAQTIGIGILKTFIP